MRKFVSENNRQIQGFWIAEPGSVLSGILEDKVPGEPRPFYVLSVDTDLKAQIRTRDEAQRTCVAGDRVGVSTFSELRGLEKFKGHRVRIECTGDSRCP